LDLAIDDEGLSTEAAWRLWNKVFSIAERFFGEERVDVCFMSELPGKLRQKIQSKGERLYVPESGLNTTTARGRNGVFGTGAG